MRALVKSSDGLVQGRIRAFRCISLADENTNAELGRDEEEAPSGAPPLPPVAEHVPLLATGKEAPPMDETETLLARIGALEAELERARDEAELGYEKRFEEGRAAGLMEAEKADRARLEVLGQAAATVSGKADEAFKSLEALGAAIAGVAIGKVLGDRDIYAQAIRDCIARQMDTIGPELVSTLHLSAEDFPDEAPVAQLAVQHSIQIELDPQLEPGACLFELSLGRLDASLGRQREAIVALLDELAAEGSAE